MKVTEHLANATEPLISFEIHKLDGRITTHEHCNVCRACYGVRLHSGYTNNEVYLRYGIKINGRTPVRVGKRGRR